MARDEKLMRSALAEARKALGRTSPNPAVGCLIVRDGKVIARGHHRAAGLPHAEIEALGKLGKKARGASLYVNLEPCCHQGRTGPCTTAIVEAGIKEVVVGMRDPNPQVNGRGIAALEKAGIRVVQGVLEEECQRLNEPFTRWITTGRPYVVLKAAVSLDGRISGPGGDPRWISGEAARADAHRLRDFSDGILVGVTTVLRDGPLLTTRFPNGPGRTGRRVVLDARARTPLTARILEPVAGSPPTSIFVSEKAPAERVAALRKKGAEVITIPASEAGVDLRAVLAKLGASGVTSLLVEGGAEIYTSFLRERLVDRVVVYVAPVMIGEEAVSFLHSLDQGLSLTRVETSVVGGDVRIEGTPVWPKAERATAHAAGRS
jgi:diaminohydroxyphosphoribosylaminopyrimidine deaminase / 5-amino-6-(5-phosphoribosylamino)uracil reductase